MVNAEPDWKQFARTDGYKSLKSAYIRSVRRGWENERQRYLKQFQWVIGRIKSWAIKSGLPMSVILDKCEDDRSFNWIGYYANHIADHHIKKSVSRLLEAERSTHSHTSRSANAEGTVDCNGELVKLE